MTGNQTTQSLQRQGWYLTASGIDACSNHGDSSVDTIVKAALDLDLKLIGERRLPEAVGKNKVEYVDGPLVLQLQKLRNISAPSINEESHRAPRMLRLSLSDGHSGCGAVELETLPKLDLNTPPGTKLQLIGRVPLNSGFLLLNKQNCKILGGRVEKLVENWELKRTLAQHSRAALGVRGAPLFIPFGQRRHEEKPKKADASFKSLDSGQVKSDSTDFEQQRQAAIAKLQDLKLDTKTKPVGSAGVNKAQHDKDVAKIVEMGFTAEDANSALRENGGNLENAINFLLNGPQRGGYPRYGDMRNMRGRNEEERGDRQRRGPPDRQDRSDRQDRQERGGRGRRGRQDDPEEGGDDVSRPSAPATLFDFLTDKIPDSKTKNKYGPTDKATLPHNPDPNYSTTVDKPPRFAKHQQDSDDFRDQPRYSDRQRDDRPKKSYNEEGAQSGKRSDFRDSAVRQSGYRGRQGGFNGKESDGTDVGSKQRGSGNDRGTYNTGNSSSRYDDRGRSNTGNSSSRYDDRGRSNTGNDRGRSNAGNSSSGYDDRGRSNTGNSSSGYDRGRSNTGNSTSRYDDRGRSNTGNSSSRYDDRGRSNTGNNSSGYDDRGGSNTGNSSLGYDDKGRLNTGNSSSRYEDRGRANTGNSYSGYDDRGRSNTGNSSSRYDDRGRSNTGNSNTRDKTDGQNPQFNKTSSSSDIKQKSSNTSAAQTQQEESVRWKPGDQCMALYYEDQQMYAASIVSMRGAKKCLVHFTDYGNKEEVFLSDLRPINKQNTSSHRTLLSAPTGTPSVPHSTSVAPPGYVVQAPPPMSFMMAFPAPSVDSYTQHEYNTMYQQQQQMSYSGDQYYNRQQTGSNNQSQNYYRESNPS